MFDNPAYDGDGFYSDDPPGMTREECWLCCGQKTVRGAETPKVKRCEECHGEGTILVEKPEHNRRRR